MLYLSTNTVNGACELDDTLLGTSLSHTGLSEGGLWGATYLCYSSDKREGSHSGLVRAPAKRLLREIGVAGSNPAPSAIPFP